MAKYTIIQCIGDGEKGGAPFHVLSLSQALKKDGHKVLVICPQGWLQTQCQQAKIAVLPVNMASAFDKTARIQVKKILEKMATEPILLHCHGVRGGIVGRLAAWSLGIPIVYTEHLWVKEYKTPSFFRGFSQLWLLKILDQKTCQTIAVSRAVADYLLDKGVVEQKKLKVIYNGVALPEVGAKIRHKGLVVGSIGAFVRIKGYQYLLEAFRHLPSPVSLWLMGKGEEEEKIRAQIIEHHLGGRVQIWEGVAEEEFFKGVDIYVQPSLSEAFGVAICQAMSYGLPVVASKVGGVREVVEEGRTGILVPCANSQALIQAIKKLIENKKLAGKMGQAGRRRVEKYFTLERMVKETEEVYQNCLHR